MLQDGLFKKGQCVVFMYQIVKIIVLASNGTANVSETLPHRNQSAMLGAPLAQAARRAGFTLFA
jgi:hypothetical protein